MLATLPETRLENGRLKVPVSRPQGNFLASQAELTLFCGGVGSGKTKAGAMWAAREALTQPGVGFVGANTYQQLHRTTLKAFCEVLTDWSVPWTFGKRPIPRWGKSPFPDHSGILSMLVQGQLRQVICSQLGSFDYLRGIEIRWFWIDETRDTSREAFNVLLARKRGGPADARRPGAVTTTPDGFDWLYDAFVGNGENALKDRSVIHADSRSNPFLPDGYVDGLLANYSARLAQQEVGGKFVSLTSGMAFAEFDRSVHIDAERCIYDPGRELIHSWDFNVNPMCSVILQEVRETGEVLAIDEIHIEGSARTWDVTGAFIARYGEHMGKVTVYGDASGRARKTCAADTDFALIEQAYQPVFSDKLRMNSNFANPSVYQSVQDVNSLLRNAKGRVRFKLHPKCEYTIRDLEQVAFRPGTRDLEKGDAGLTHHSDALRYFVSMRHPAKSNKASEYTPQGW